MACANVLTDANGDRLADAAAAYLFDANDVDGICVDGLGQLAHTQAVDVTARRRTIDVGLRTRLVAPVDLAITR